MGVQVWHKGMLDQLAYDYVRMDRHALQRIYGRTPSRLRAVLRRYGYTEQRDPRIQADALRAGLRRYYDQQRGAGVFGIRGVARALGVQPKSVPTWYDNGWIKQVGGKRSSAVKYRFNNQSITDFLYLIGGMMRLHPSLTWQATYDDARSTLTAKYVMSSQIRDVLALHWLCYVKQRKGFPDPVFDLGNAAGGQVYARADVAQWLRSNPRYVTSAARKEFGL